MKFNIPNQLTILRILLTPVFLIFLLYPMFGEDTGRVIAAVVFLITALTDTLDGLIARASGSVTDFGKFLDTLADKFLIISAFAALSASETYRELSAPLIWLTVVVLLRELAVTSLRLTVKSSGGETVAANLWGKLKMIVQCVCILTVILEPLVLDRPLGLPSGAVSVAMIVLTFAITLYSGYTYFKQYWKYIDPTR